ncbi:hypothetical protein P4S72_18910 [Vibrio sp. PP-XX7]
MRVNFHLLKNNISWDAVIHQLNRDVLRRHVLVKGNVDHIDIDFSYCETSGQGHIMNNHRQIIGNFSLTSQF